MRRDEALEARLVAFAVRVIKFCGYLPHTQAGAHIAGQMLAGGTAPAVLYVEAGLAENRTERVAALRLCGKELAGVGVWLRIVAESDMLPPFQLEAISQEHEALCDLVEELLQNSLADEV